jgi:hypothetical protein
VRDLPMRRFSAWLALCLGGCLGAAAVAGCGTVQAAAPGHQGGHSGTPGATPNGAVLPAGCHSAAAAITQADNGRTFCIRVGETVTVLLRSNNTSLWLQPLASSGVLTPVPGGGASLVKGVTGAWFSAVRPGRVLVTSVRPPCQVTVSGQKGGLEPSDQVPRSYPLRFCAPGHRFSVSIVVAR